MVLRRAILDRALREGGFGEYGTATGGSTSTITDTTFLASSQYVDDEWVGAWARISKDAGGAGAAPEAEIRPITNSVASTGVLTVDPVFSAAVVSTDSYQIWRNLHPQRVLDTLDQILAEECYLPDWTLLTEVPDGDMEQNNTTDWTASNVTHTKVTSEPAMWGKRWSSVATTTAGGYIQNAAALRVIPGKRYHVSALVRASAASTTAQLIAYDNTNSTAIATKTSANQATVRLYADITIPAGCYDLRIRMGNSENTVTSLWDEVCVFAYDTKRLPLPFFVKNKQQIKGIFRPSFDQIATDTWGEYPTLTLDANRWDFMPSGFGRGQTALLRRDSNDLRPTYIFCTRPETAYANDNVETKHLDANWINAALCFHLFNQMCVQPNAGIQNLEWARERKAYWEKEYKSQKRKQEERIQDVIQTAMPDAYIYSDPERGYWGIPRVA